MKSAQISFSERSRHTHYVSLEISAALKACTISKNPPAASRGPEPEAAAARAQLRRRRLLVVHLGVPLVGRPGQWDGDEDPLAHRHRRGQRLWKLADDYNLPRWKNLTRCSFEIN
jgi:hypothetical protein